MEKGEYVTMAAVERQHWWYVGMRTLSAAWLDHVFASRRDLHILDAGCGTGGDALFLRRYGTVIGLDYAAEAAAFVGERLPGRFARGSVLDLPFAEHSFDLVTSYDVLYHTGVPDEIPALREVRRVLRPEGHLLLRLPAYEWLRSRHDRQVHTRRRYVASEVRQMLARAGFVVERLSYVLSLLFPLPATTRLLERFQPDHGEASAMELPGTLLNTILYLPMAFEANWLKMGGTFPYGLSILCLARVKPALPKTMLPRMVK
ncbi:methyltransferase domain-containing protein [Candidatus Chloroploca sp. M-50]|uniref:Methyltransferase domain-containing protein n=1 Tax=Candidatus Chloroploca mongolica TaxID=2528176 RepID=A0ABS4D6C9_9CHLR|nr:class I SAM-dependent methyltransferase [Candidatus Chloroploca mongolica]MBP1464988.1 methyltransferase domain-containing protein [Candidatus Chloroploca mongolica]